MSKLLGIDLGTTNSCVAIMENGQAKIIPNDQGEHCTPSVVSFNEDGTRYVGQMAKRQASINPTRTISSIKRLMGTNEKITIDHHQYSPQEISAMILTQLKQDAQKYLNEPVTDAVITVPAYFTDGQRQATKDAGKIAGLNVLRIINEPTSAALAYGIDANHPQKIVVYDLGGGTFDVSVLSIDNGVIEVVATSGNNHLGGDDFDATIREYVLEQFEKENHVKLRKDVVAMQRIIEACEKAKVELSAVTETKISLPFIYQKNNEYYNLEVNLTRDKFNELTRRLVLSTIDPIRQALADAHLTVNDINSVLLVGGSSRIIAVQQELKNFFHKEPSKAVNPDECVACGACIQAGVLAGNVTGLLLLDVMPLSLGIETVGGVCTKVINRNTSIPIKKSQIFTTSANFQSSVDIHILQGEHPMASGNKSIGKFRLKGIKRALAGTPQIEVTFDIDVNGIVNVSAKDLATNKQQEITISDTSNLSDQEINEAIYHAQEYERDSERRKADTNFKVEVEAMINEAKEVVKKLSGEEKHQIEGQIKATKKALKEPNSQQLVNEYERLKNSVERYKGQS